MIDVLMDKLRETLFLFRGVAAVCDLSYLLNRGSKWFASYICDFGEVWTVRDNSSGIYLYRSASGLASRLCLNLVPAWNFRLLIKSNSELNITIGIYFLCSEPKRDLFDLFSPNLDKIVVVLGICLVWTLAFISPKTLSVNTCFYSSLVFLSSGNNFWPSISSEIIVIPIVVVWYSFSCYSFLTFWCFKLVLIWSLFLCLTGCKFARWTSSMSRFDARLDWLQRFIECSLLMSAADDFLRLLPDTLT